MMLLLRSKVMVRAPCIHSDISTGLVTLEGAGRGKAKGGGMSNKKIRCEVSKSEIVSALKTSTSCQDILSLY